MHADKDKQEFSNSGVYVTPTLATMTYLTFCVPLVYLWCTFGGTPTVVIDSAVGAEGVLENNGQMTALVCVPKIGRQLRFNGSLLRGVPIELAPELQTTVRVTLLVDVWLGYKPKACVSETEA